VIRRYSDGKYSAHYANNMLCRPDFVYDPLNTDEHTEQALVIEWARSHVKEHPCLAWLHSSMNGIPLSGSKMTRGKIMNYMKAEGATKGIPDLFLPVARRGFHGIYLEMKRVYDGELTPEQKKFLSFAKEEGYLALQCRGHKAGIANLRWYLSDEKEISPSQ
jgi:hypothetical protein